MRNRILSVLMLLVVSGQPLMAQQVETGFVNRMVNVGGQEYRYQVYVPTDYAARTDWPVILFLHGAGTRGRDGIIQTTNGLAPAIRRDPNRFPAIVVFPQVPRDSVWADAPADAAMAALRQTMTAYRVDVDRVYLTGLSMGGRGAWYLAYRNPDLFAAVAPISGWITQTPPLTKTFVVPPDSGAPFPALARQLRDVPIWIFHGEMDRLVPVIGSRAPAAALREAGGKVRYTEYLGTNHNAWDTTYASKEFVDWLFGQRRQQR